MNTTTNLTETQITYLADMVKRLKRINNKHDRWFDHVDAYRAGTVEWNLRLMPGKQSKYYAYTLTRQILHLLQIEAPAEIARTRSVWAWTIAQAS